jgi:hypothetical protein
LSGQMDPETFIDFLPTGPSSTDIYAEGMRAHILFIALRCGTPEGDTDALNFSRKTAPMGVGSDDLNTTDSNEDYGATARRATKRQRGNEMKESEMVEQGRGNH